MPFLIGKNKELQPLNAVITQQFVTLETKQVAAGAEVNFSKQFNIDEGYSALAVVGMSTATGLIPKGWDLIQNGQSVSITVKVRNVTASAISGTVSVTYLKVWNQ